MRASFQIMTLHQHYFFAFLVVSFFKFGTGCLLCYGSRASVMPSASSGSVPSYISERETTTKDRRPLHHQSSHPPFLLVVAAERSVSFVNHRFLQNLRSENQEGQANNEDEESSMEEEKPKQKESEDEKDAMSTAMIASIGFYKKVISPLLPPACRFVPTCSPYGVQAIEEFGPTKGGMLIAWRLLRCSPIGGKGYDPPKWPPVPYTYSSY